MDRGSQIIVFSIVTVIILSIDFYVYFGFINFYKNWSKSTKFIFNSLYWGSTVFFFCVNFAIRWMNLTLKPGFFTFLFSFFMALLIAKVFVVLFLLVDDVIRLFRLIIKNASSSNTVVGNGISRLKFLQFTGLGLGTLFLGNAIAGVAVGAHNYKVNRRKLKLKNLPSSFDGISIAQISDIHSGSFWDPEAVKKGVQMLMDEKPDMVFFTGDLVNNYAHEIEPFINTFSAIKAPLGVYSILGNHDYADYVIWPDKGGDFSEGNISSFNHFSPMQQKNLDTLIAHHKKMGWDILLDEHRIIEKNGDKLAVIGVQNWSAKKRFPKYGNLKKAYQGTEDISVKLLLSHDPSHWKEEVVNKFKDISATFSGHTHGMQFGIDTKYYRWSPVKYVYEEWADLYQENDQYLYVNRGFGYLGFPGRMGIFPEITVFTLEKA